MVTIHVECPVCSETVEIEVDEESIQNSARNPVPIVYPHGVPEHALTAFVDKEYRVRAVSGANIVQRIEEARSQPRRIARRYIPIPKEKFPNLKGLTPLQIKILALVDGKTSVEELTTVLATPAARIKIVCEQLVRLGKLERIQVVME